MMYHFQKAVLKIDIDTERAMHDCVPRMLEELDKRGLKATFCIPTAEDRSGLALMRAFKQRGFIGKMIRNRAWRVFHPRTFVAGTLLTGRSQISHREMLLKMAQYGHEIGLHGYSHQVWQDGFEHLDFNAFEDQICLGLDAYRAVFEQEAPFFAAPAWKFNRSTLKALCLHNITISSSCRGYQAGWMQCGADSIFELPTLPATLDEILPYGRFDAGREVDTVMSHAEKATLPVFGLHAEFEGGTYIEFFKTLLNRLAETGYQIITISEAAQLLKGENLPELALMWKDITGRTYPVAWVEEAGE